MTEALQLRAEFDQSFTLAPAEPATDEREFVIVKAGGTSFALPVTGLSGIERQKVIVPVPSKLPALLGLAGVRNGIVPVFSLAKVLGIVDSGLREEELIALIKVTDTDGSNISAEQLVGLAFDEVVQFARVSGLQIFAGSSSQDTTLEYEEQLHTIVDLPTLIAQLTSSAPSRSAADQKFSQDEAL